MEAQAPADAGNIESPNADLETVEVPNDNASAPAVVPVQKPKATKASAKTATTPDVEAPAETPAELFDLVVDGQKVQVTRDQLIMRAQKAEAAQKRFEKAAELTKKNQRAFELLQANPEAALEELGVDLDALAEARMLRRFEESQLTPEQKQMRDLQAKLSQYEEAEKSTQTKAEEQKQAQAYEHVATQLEKTFIEAAQAQGLERSPAALEAMTEVALEAVELGIPMTADQIAAEVKDRMEAQGRKRDQRIASGLKGDQLLGYLGPATVEAVLQASMAKLRGAPAYEAKQADPEPATRDDGGYLSPADFRRMNKLK